jgi:Cu+-exporting ATPase
MVYQLLQENGLCTYYDLERNPGFKIKASPKGQFAYLDNEEIVGNLLDFQEGDSAKICFYIPKIHCSSCIWLLENLYKLEKGIVSSRVNFLRKEIEILFHKNETSLRHIVEVLDSFGYTPEIHLDNLVKKESKREDKSLMYKIGVSGFFASNIMMFSFPEYFGLDNLLESGLRQLFGGLNLLFALPVVLYGASDYFLSAWKGLRNKVLNLEVPIALGILAVFIRSAYEVLSHTGPGYFDSLTWLIFFLLIGKWIQSKTYKHFSFERDYQSYFPIAVTKLVENEECPIPIQQLKKGDHIWLRNNEIVPADAQLLDRVASIDYSFVTGESQPVLKEMGEKVFAGGKLLGNGVRMKVEKEVAHSYLLQLWNQHVFKKEDNAYLSSFVLLFSRYFVMGTLIITLLTGAYWYVTDPTKLLFAVTSVLLVACPCALALSLPFALSNCLRLLSKQGLYLKNADVVEKLAEVDTIVFDKTGTLTRSEGWQVEYVGDGCSEKELSYIRSAVNQSIHPMSRAICAHLTAALVPIAFFQETIGKGITARVDECQIRVGSAQFLHLQSQKTEEMLAYVEIDGKVRGFFKVNHHFRTGWVDLLTKLKQAYEMHLLSGDSDQSKVLLSPLLEEKNIKFNQLPVDKLEYVLGLQKEGKKVLVLGDGLNDAGALKAADVGIAISEDMYHFSPACDGILEGNQLVRLPSFLEFGKWGRRVILSSLVLSLLYNGVGLYYAVQGLLSPVIAAVLMPLSSVSVVLFVIAGTTLGARKALKARGK